MPTLVHDQRLGRRPSSARERRVGERRGDLAVVLARSPIGQPPRTVANLHALGLWDIGDLRVHDQSPAVLGMVRAVTHLVEVRRLALPADSQPSVNAGAERADEYSGAAAGTESAMTPYIVLDREARRVDLPDGQFFACELYDGYFSLTWTCDLSWLEVLDRTRDALPPADEADVQIELASGETSDMPAGELLARDLVGDPDEVMMFRADYDDVSLVWHAPALRREGKNPLRVVHGEAGLVARVYDAELFEQAIRKTGSIAVAAAAASLADVSTYIAKYVHHSPDGSR